MDVATSTWKRRGFFGFYRGLSSNILFAFPRVSLRFGTFNAFTDWRVRSRPASNAAKDGSAETHVLERQKKRQQPGAGLNPLERVAGGLMCGILEAAFIVTPMTTIQVKLIQDFNRSTPHYRGLFHGIRTIA